MLTQRKANQYKKTLNSMLEQLTTELRHSMAQEQTTAEAPPTGDWTDLASSQTEKDLRLKMRNRDKKMIADIDAALMRIESKTFGLCLSCEEDISESRLAARPTTTLCIDCMSEIEVSTPRLR